MQCFYKLNIKLIFFQTDPNDPNGPDLDTKIDELKHAIRRAEVKFIPKKEKVYYYYYLFWYVFKC